MSVNPIPENFRSITPYLHVQGIDNLAGFITHAFGAKTLRTSRLPDGTGIYVCMQIGDSVIEISEVRGDFKPMPCAIHLYVQDVDAVYAKAVEIGAVSVMQPSDQFYGDREAFIIDPCGNYWYIAARIENLSEEELQQKMNAFIEEQSKSQHEE